jgi:hypothetical protein
MQTDLASSLAINKCLISRVVAKGTSLLLAKESRPPQNESLSLYKKKNCYCLAVKGAPRAQSSRVEIGAYSNETKMLIFSNLFFWCWLQRAEESRNQ